MGDPSESNLCRKLGELLGSPDMKDNQQPSWSGDIPEGSTTRTYLLPKKMKSIGFKRIRSAQPSLW